MRVLVTVHKQQLAALIDSGPTHNFSSDKVVDRLQLPVVPTTPFLVKVANGQPLSCHGRFEKVDINIQGMVFKLNLYSLPLIGLDLVLGIHWLEQLGSVMCNWKKITMEFIWDGKPSLLQGLNGRPMQRASEKEMRQQNALFAVCMQTPSTASSATAKADLQEVLDPFENIFRDPDSLLPAREIDHRIILKEGTEPIC